MSMNIEQTLAERFSRPLKENYDRRVIFWQDPDEEFAALAESLSIEGVTFIMLTGKNNFAVKTLLSDPGSAGNYLVYNPMMTQDIKENWLADIMLYSEEFRADLVSIKMQELNLPNTAQARKAIKTYKKFFDNKERAGRLAAFQSDYSAIGQLHLDILAVLAGTVDNTFSGVIRAVLLGGLEAGQNAAINAVKKFGNEVVFWELIEKVTGFAHHEGSTLMDLASHVFISALSMTMDAGSLKGLERYISQAHQQACYTMVNEWLEDENDSAIYNLIREVEERLDLAGRFDHLDTADLLRGECFPCINECILRKIMGEVSEDVIKPDEIIAIVEKRRTLKWYQRCRHEYEGLLQLALMRQFYQANSTGFHLASHQELWQSYCAKYCAMDHFYRKFHLAFSKSQVESATSLEDLYKNVADRVEQLYKNWFLTALGGQWTKLIQDEMARRMALPGIAQQADFYKNHVRPIEASGGKVFVIISDALRYEVAVELAGQLIKETKGTAQISSMQAAFPTTTRFGMAALLPHQKISLTDELSVLCDGEPSDSTINREKVLKKTDPNNVALSYKAFIAMKKAERRETIAKARAVYIYHNAIDAAGDKTTTEDQVFEACEQAVAELKTLVRLIVGDMGGTNIFITSDHGFVYSYKPLEESDKAEKSFLTGDVKELGRRYILASSQAGAEHMLRVPLSDYHSDLTGFTPLQNIRMKKQGGGMNYVHGGVSLQELVVPVITYKNIRPAAKKYVDIKKAALQLTSQGRKISNSIFSLDFYQVQEVGGKVIPAKYEVFMANEAGQPVSDKQIIIADKTSKDGSQRMFRTRLTLKNLTFRKTEAYYLTVVEKESGQAVSRTEFTIDIAFTNDFDF